MLIPKPFENTTIGCRLGLLAAAVLLATGGSCERSHTQRRAVKVQPSRAPAQRLEMLGPFRFGHGQPKILSKAPVDMSGSFTVSFQARQRRKVSTSIAVGHGADQAELSGPDSTGKALHIGFRDNGKFTCAFYADDLDTQANVNDGRWHSYACSYDAVSRARQLVIDGEVVARDFATGPYRGRGKLYIGGTSWAPADFEGMIRKVEVSSEPFSGALKNTKR